MADIPQKSLHYKSPLEFAHTPYMDYFASQGKTVFTQTIPYGFTAGSDIGNMSLLGYSPKKYHTGRGPIEAAALNLPKEHDRAYFRCNFVTVVNDILTDFTADHITTEESRHLLNELSSQLKNSTVSYHLGSDYKHILSIKGFHEVPQTSPPHEITGQSITPFLPKNSLLLDIINKSKNILKDSTINKTRLQNNRPPVTDIWPWSGGAFPTFPPFYNTYNKKGVLFTTVNVVQGLGKLMALDTVMFPSEKRVEKLYTAIKKEFHSTLENYDFFYIHIQDTDDASHDKDLPRKIHAIEMIDRIIIKDLFEYTQQNKNTRLFIGTDHQTLVSTGQHTAAPVPALLCGYNVSSDNNLHFSDQISTQEHSIVPAEQLFSSFMVKKQL